MSGHNKWSSIKHDKGIADARRGQLFTKLTREIMVAVRQGGSDPDANSRLRLALQKAKAASMPRENIERAIKKGEGTLEGGNLTEAVLEGYGPGGTAILIEVLSDNHNRTVQDVRRVLTRSGGNLGSTGSASWIFDTKGLILVDADELDFDEVALQAIDAGADDVEIGKNHIEVYTPPELLEEVRGRLIKAGIPVSESSVTRIPKTTVQLDDETAVQMAKLLERLEELDDVQEVYSNAEFSDEALAKISS